jgi:hypothetical protein
MARRMAAARAAKERRRMEGDACPPPVRLPELRREVIVRDHDFGLVEYRFEFLRTTRTDCYRLVCDGVVLAERIGWARALEVIRKGFIRVRAA